MPIFDETIYLIPIMLLPFIYALIFDKQNRIKLLILIPLIIFLSDQSGLLLKKYFLRSRPWASLEIDTINHLVAPKGRNYSFPSNHAANISGLALIFSSIYKQYKNIFWIIAITVMFSRIYIGVHFPSDIMMGLFIGSFYGFVLIKIWSGINKNN